MEREPGVHRPRKRRAATAARGCTKGDPEKGDGGGAGKRGERVPAEATAKDRAALSRAAERDMASRRVSEKTPPGEAADRSAKRREEDGSAGEIQFDRKRFIWPVSGKVVAKFGTESITTDFNGRKVETAKIMNNGIKIAAAAGTPVDRRRRRQGRLFHDAGEVREHDHYRA